VTHGYGPVASVEPRALHEILERANEEWGCKVVHMQVNIRKIVSCGHNSCEPQISMRHANVSMRIIDLHSGLSILLSPTNDTTE
jgi:hypothetical protein